MVPPAESEPPPSSREEIMRRAGPYLGLGSTFLASIAVCLFGGWWLDGALGTSPWLTVTGAFLGIAMGFYLFVKTITSAARRNEGGKEK